MYDVCTEDDGADLVSDIGRRLEHWIASGYVQLQTLAVMACSNLVLNAPLAHRTALTQTRILDSVIRKITLFLLSVTVSPLFL